MVTPNTQPSHRTPGNVDWLARRSETSAVATQSADGQRAAHSFHRSAPRPWRERSIGVPADKQTVRRLITRFMRSRRTPIEQRLELPWFLTPLP